MSGIEGVGEAVTGTIIARAVEPDAGEAAGHAAVCLNCGTALAGAYCHRCGQSGHVHRTLTAWWHDLAHGVLHLDGKIWRTLPLLVWRPGELTRRYVEGERARFVSPIALFLFSVFLMFAMFSAIGGPISGEGKTPIDLSGDAEERAELKSRLEQLQKDRVIAVKEKRGTRPIDVSISAIRQEIAVRNSLGGEAVDKDGGEFVTADLDGAGSTLEAAFNKAKGNPSLLAYKVQTNAYKFSWALIPLSVPFVWLLFLWRRKYRLYDHTVFVTYSLAFVSLLVIAASVARAIGLSEALAVVAIVLLPPLHMYRQLRGAYQLSRFSALWRTLFLVTFAFVAILLFFIGLLALGALG